MNECVPIFDGANCGPPPAWSVSPILIAPLGGLVVVLLIVAGYRDPAIRQRFAARYWLIRLCSQVILASALLIALLVTLAEPGGAIEQIIMMQMFDSPLAPVAWIGILVALAIMIRDWCAVVERGGQ